MQHPRLLLKYGVPPAPPPRDHVESQGERGSPGRTGAAPWSHRLRGGVPLRRHGRQGRRDTASPPQLCCSPGHDRGHFCQAGLTPLCDPPWRGSLPPCSTWISLHPTHHTTQAAPLWTRAPQRAVLPHSTASISAVVKETTVLTPLCSPITNTPPAWLTITPGLQRRKKPEETKDAPRPKPLLL